MTEHIPHAPPRWARGDVGREIGKWILAEIKEQLSAAGINGHNIDGGHVVGVVPPAASALTLDDLTDVTAPTPTAGQVLTWDAAATPTPQWIAADPTGGSGGGGGVSVAHEEFIPANTATTVTLAHTPTTVLVVTRNGVTQSVAGGHYTLAAAVLTFTTAFDGTERVVVAYAYGASGGGGTGGSASALDPGADINGVLFTGATDITITAAPTAHASTHQPGGTDPMAVDAAAATGSLRTLGTGATNAAAGDHTHSFDTTTADARYVPLAGGAVMTGGLSPAPGMNLDLGADQAWGWVFASTVSLDNQIIIRNPIATNQIVGVSADIPGENFYRYTMRTDGQMRWGPGTIERDVTLARTAAATLTLTGSLVATGFTGPLTGNASTATALQTARTINGVAFDGTTNITITAAPTTHASTHAPGGSDPLTVDAAAATGSLRTLGTTSTSAAAGNHTHTFDTTTGDARYVNVSGDIMTGDLGLSSTPPAWSGYRAVHVGTFGGGVASGISGNTASFLLRNLYYDGSAWRNIGIESGELLQLANRAFLFLTGTNSGAVGGASTVAQIAQVDANGLGLGTVGATAGIIVNAARNQDSTLIMQVQNQNNTSSAAAIVQATSPAGSLSMWAFPAAYGAPYGNKGMLRATLPGGLIIQATNATGNIEFHTAGGSPAAYFNTNGHLVPGLTNNFDLGDGATPLRWRTVYAVNAFNTSHSAYKRDWRRMDPDYALRVARSTEIGTFRMRSNGDNDPVARMTRVGLLADRAHALLSPDGVHVSGQDTACLALAAIAALCNRVEQLEAQLKEQR